ncbi:MAG: hypothetical protein KDI01_02260 [Halioglobus sp.]|nr:hypothetical protein [Halioglobus sp.]
MSNTPEQLKAITDVVAATGDIEALAGCDRPAICPALLQELAADQVALARLIHER